MKHCLVIDDSHVIRKVAQRIFEDLGFKTSEAPDTESAIGLCRKELPDAILLDGNMPDTEGVEFIRSVRGGENGDAPVILFLTTENDVGLITRALEAGANDYIMKPIDRESVEAKLAEVGLGRSEDTASA